MKFKYWLENVFWYHFKWYWLFGVAVVSFVIMIIIGNIRTVHYDWNVAFIRGGSAVYSSHAYTNEEIVNYFENILPDTDGNRSTRINLSNVFTVDVGESGAKSGAENAFYALANPDCYIALMDTENFERWSELGYIVESKYSQRLSQYVVVIDPPIVLTDRDSAKTIGMSDTQISENDNLIRETHDNLLAVALDALNAVE